MRCFKCEKPLELFDPQPEYQDWIDRGMRFRSSGGYGSHVYDDTSGHVVINICDDCITDAANKQLIQTQNVIKRAEPAVTQYVAWDQDLYRDQ